jgi:hypothetical protein
MTGYYRKVFNDLEPGHTARSGDINLIQSSVDNAISDLAVDIEGPAVIIGGDEDAFKITPSPDAYDQKNTTTNTNDQWLSFYEKYLRQKIRIEKSEINSIKICLQNNTSYPVTVIGEIRNCETNNLLKESKCKLLAKQTSQDIIFNFGLKHIQVGDYYFIIRPINLSAVDFAYNEEDADEGIEYNGTGLEQITSDSFKIKYDTNGTYTVSQGWNESGLKYSYNGVDYTSLYDTEISDVIYADLWFEEKFTSTDNTYLINPGTALILGQKVYLLDTHVNIDGPSSSGNRADLIAMMSNGQVEVIKGNATEGVLEVPILHNALQIAYIVTYKSTSTTWKCPYCGSENTYTCSVCGSCGKGTNTLIPVIIQDDTNGITRQRDLKEEVRRLKKYANYNEDRNAPSRIHYTCVLNALEEENGDNPENMVTAIDDNGNIVYMTNDNTVEQFYWTFRDFENIVDKDIIIGEFYALSEKASSVTGFDGSDKKYHKVWENKCPKCGSKSTLVITNLDDGTNEITCDKGNGGCGNNYCGFSGYDLTNTTSTLQLTAGTEPKDVTGSPVIQDMGEKINISTTTTQLPDIVSNATGAAPIDNNKVVDAFTADNFNQDNKVGQPPALKHKDGQDNIFDNLLEVDTNSTDGLNIDTSKGEITLKANKYDDDYTTNKPVANQDKVNEKSETIGYVINNDTATLGQQQSQFPALNFELDTPMYVKSITPQITEFNGMENFSVVLFKDDAVFNPQIDKFVCYTKKFKDDYTFPNVYESDPVPLKNAITQKNGNQKLSTPYEFPVDTEIPAGKYTLLVYGTPSNNKGTIYVDCFNTKDGITKFGSAMTCRGPSTPTIVYIEPTNVKDYTWDLLIKHKKPQYAEIGTLYSQTIETELPIRTVSTSKTYVIPDGCSIKTYVSNNGGRTYTEINNEPIKFNSTGKLFKWKIVLKGTGSSTPTIKYNSQKGFAMVYNVGEAISDVKSTDYKRRLETRVMDAGWINANILGNAYTYKNFSEWEFVRIWAEENDGDLDIDIFISYNETPVIPITANAKDTHNNVFYSTVFADLTLGDFSQTSVDYSVNDEDVEFDEHNYRMDLNTDVMYNEAQGVVVSYGIDGMGDINSHNTEDERKISGVFTYEQSPASENGVEISKIDRYEIAKYEPTNEVIANGVITGDFDALYSKSSEVSGYSTETIVYNRTWTNKCPKCGKTGTLISHTNTNLKSEILCDPILGGCGTEYCGFSGYKINPESTAIQLYAKNTSICYYNSSSNEYNPSTVILGKAFPSGIDMRNYNKLALDIVPYLANTPTEYTSDKKPTRTTIPAGTLEVVVALNVNGSIEDTEYVTDENGNVVSTYKVPNATYGKAYPINQDLIAGQHNNVVITAIKDDVYGYGSVKSIGIRVRDVVDKNTLRYLVDGSTEYSDYIGVASIKLEADNIYSLIPSENQNRQWTVPANQNVDYLLTVEDINGQWGLMEFDIGDNVTGDIGIYTRDIDVNTTNWYYISYYCTEPFNKGEFIVNLYGDTNGTDLIESFYLPAWDYTDISTNSWKKLWGNNVDESTIASPGHSFFMGAWFKRRNYNNPNVKMIKLVRNDVDDSISSIGTFAGKTLIILTIRGYKSKSIPSFGPKLKLRMYPKSIENLKAPTIRKFGVVYTLS